MWATSVQPIGCAKRQEETPPSQIIQTNLVQFIMQFPLRRGDSQEARWWVVVQEQAAQAVPSSDPEF